MPRKYNFNYFVYNLLKINDLCKLIKLIIEQHSHLFAFNHKNM